MLSVGHSPWYLVNFTTFTKPTFLRTECWKMCVCRCQTRVMIAAISLETGRNVFTNQPNVTPVPSDPCVRSPCCWSNIYLFIYFRGGVSPTKRKEIELFFFFQQKGYRLPSSAKQIDWLGCGLDWQSPGLWGMFKYDFTWFWKLCKVCENIRVGPNSRHENVTFNPYRGLLKHGKSEEREKQKGQRQRKTQTYYL